VEDVAGSKARNLDGPQKLTAFWNFSKREAELAMDGKTCSTKDVSPATPGDEGFLVIY
jgi:hypothetical protein